MTTHIPTSAPTRSAAEIDAYCPAFAHVVGSLRDLLDADLAACGLPQGDPACDDGAERADRSLDWAIWAAERGSYETRTTAFRFASEHIVMALTATTGSDVDLAIAGLDEVCQTAGASSGKAVQAVLRTCSDLVEQLAAVWAADEAEAALPSSAEDDSDLLDDEAWWEDLDIEDLMAA